MDEDEAIAWQDVLDEIAAGRPGNTACPYCRAAPMKVESLTEAMTGQSSGSVLSGPMRVSCGSCGKYIEVNLGGY